MKKVLVLYKTKYGSAKRYAEWIAEDLNCEIMNFDDAKKSVLEDYDIIVYGGGVHAGGIRGFDVYEKWLKKYLWLVDNPKKTFVCFACGMNVQGFEARAQLREVNFGKKWLQPIICYYFDGAFDPANIKGIDKQILKLSKNMILGKGELNLTEADKELLRRMNEGYSNVDRAQIARLVENVKELMNA